MKGRIKPKGFEIAAITVLFAALIVASAASAVDDAKNADGRGLVKTIPISGYLTPSEDTDDFPFNVSNGRGCDWVSAEVLVSSMHFFDRLGDISIELVDPDGKKVDGDEIWGTENYLNFNYEPGHSLKAGTWHIYVKGKRLNSESGYDGSAHVFNLTSQ
ncbi:MAG: hypothetical protein U9N07_09945 [Euryarchaeota archaeon]|nr:hypothetical protein [Euryarchaeota archaeon]